MITVIEIIEDWIMTDRRYFVALLVTMMFWITQPASAAVDYSSPAGSIVLNANEASLPSVQGVRVLERKNAGDSQCTTEYRKKN
jgi:hypothetical protein